MATRVAAAGGGDWNTGSSWVGGVAPTAADDAQIPATAGNMSIGSGAVCRSADFSTYTGTLSGTGTLTIGDATAGLSNIALKLVAGMTVSGPPGFSFISTSATQQTVDFAGKTTGNVTFNATSNGSWLYTGVHNCGATATVTLTKGSLDINGQTCSWGLFNMSNSNVKSFTAGAANITLTGTGNVLIGGNSSNTTFSMLSSTITLTGANVSIGGSYSTVFSFGTVIFSGGGNMLFASGTGANTSFINLTVNGTASKTDNLTSDTVIVISGIFTLAGNSATNRLLIKSPTPGSSRIWNNTGATNTWSNVDFQDVSISSAFDASSITGGSGDCGGNSNITFTTPATQTWSGTSGGNWSENAWTSRVPLPQDDVVINAAFSASQTVTADMPRLGKSIDWTGTTGNPTWSFSSVATTIFGSQTLISGMVISGTNTVSLAGRGSFTLTSAGQTVCPHAYTIVAPGGTYTLNDAITCSGGTNITLTNGTFDTGNFNVTCSGFLSTNSNTRSMILGTSTITIQGTTASTLVNFGTTTGLTFSGASSTVVFSSVSANTRTFAGGGLTWGTLTYTVAGSTGQLNITGANTFGTINFADPTNARSLLFTAGTTTTITSAFNVQGTVGKLMTVSSLTAATHTLTKAAGTVGCNYLNVSYSIATGGASWYAGANSTDSLNNTGWQFTTAPFVASKQSGGLDGMLSLNFLGI